MTGCRLTRLWYLCSKQARTPYVKFECGGGEKGVRVGVGSSLKETVSVNDVNHNRCVGMFRTKETT